MSEIWGRFHKPIYALRQTFTPIKASQKFNVERKMALHPTFSLYEIDPWMLESLDLEHKITQPRESCRYSKSFYSIIFF